VICVCVRVCRSACVNRASFSDGYTNHCLWAGLLLGLIFYRKGKKAPKPNAPAGAADEEYTFEQRIKEAVFPGLQVWLSGIQWLGRAVA
jgi:hypothetical protein